MMISAEGFVRGLAKYCRQELLTKYPEDSLLRFGLGIYVDSVTYKPDALIEKVNNNPIFRSAMTEGNIDVEMLKKLAQDNLSEKGLAITLPFGGTVRFKREDLETICNCIESQ